MVEANILNILQQNKILDRKKPLIVGVSGGPDSLCLLDALHQAGFAVIAAHLNHGIRPEAGEEVAFVERAAGRMGISCLSRRVNTAQYADAHTLSLEEAARIIRYRFLFEQAALVGAQAVAVAHTADDQVETVLMHLLRGAGLQGLKGMPEILLPNPWSREIPLIRPLLAAWREDVLAYCRERGLEPVLDSSNQDTRFYRNRLRHELIPLLESYHPGARRAILRTTRVLAGEDGVLEQQVERAWQESAVEPGEGTAGFRIAELGVLPLGLQRRLIRRGIGLLRPGLRDIDFQTIERVLEFIANPARSFRTDLASGLALALEGEILWLITGEADLPGAGWPQVPAGASPCPLGTPGQVKLVSGWILQAGPPEDAREALSRAVANQDPYQAWLSGEALPLAVRGRLPGERFRPLGMEGHSLKLSDYMINVKLPSRARANWPLVISGQGQIAWIPGFRQAHPYRLIENTPGAVHLRLFSE